MIHGFANSAAFFSPSRERANSAMMDLFAEVSVPITLMDAGMVDDSITKFECIAVENADMLTPEQFAIVIGYWFNGGCIMLAFENPKEEYHVSPYDPAVMDKIELVYSID